MVFRQFLEVRTYTAGGYIWEDITNFLVSFTDIEELTRDKETGEAAAVSFDITVKNDDGFWFDLEKADSLGRRIGKGDDPYSKGLRGRRMRVGTYNVNGDVEERHAWATGTVVSVEADTENKTFILNCVSLEEEAKNTRIDADSGEDGEGDDYGIRGHRIDSDSDDFTNDDSKYAFYISKTSYTEDDYSTDYELFEATRVNNVLAHIQDVMEVNAGEIETVVRKAYYRNSDGDLVRRKANDQIRVKNATTFGDVSEQFGLTMADLNGNICMVHDDGTDGRLTYFNYRTNEWMKWQSYPDWLAYRATGLTGCNIPPNTQARLFMYNTVSQRFLWVTGPESDPYIWEYDPAGAPSSDTVTSIQISATLGIGINIHALCFAQSTTASANGSLFIAYHPGAVIPPSPGTGIYELDVSDLAGAGIPVLTGPIADPNVLAGDPTWPWLGPGFPSLVEWGRDSQFMYVWPTASYCNIGTPWGGSSGLICSLDRKFGAWAPPNPPKDYSLIWIDIYGQIGVVGTAYRIWADATGTDPTSRVQATFRISDPSSNNVVIFPISPASTTQGDTLVRIPDTIWGLATNYAGIPTGAGDSRHAYFDPNGGQGIIVDSQYEFVEEGSANRYTRFYFWASQYYGAFGFGKLQSTDGQTLRSENKSIITDRYGEAMQGAVENAKPSTNLCFTRDSNSQLLVSGGFSVDTTTPTDNWIFMYGYEIFWTHPLFDIRDLTLDRYLSMCAQLTGYDYWFNGEGDLSFINRGPDANRTEWTYTESDNINQVILENPIGDDLINSLGVLPWQIVLQGQKDLGGDIKWSQRQTTHANTQCQYLRILPSCDVHTKVKVEITTGGVMAQFEVYEWDNGTDSWIIIAGGPWNCSQNWTDPVNGRYEILTGWWLPNDFSTFVVGDQWVFWSYIPFPGLESMEDRFRYEIIDTDSIKEHGKYHVEINDNRFLSKNELQYISDRLLQMFRLPRKIYQIKLPLQADTPKIGDTVHFEDNYTKVDLSMKFRVLSRTRSIGSWEPIQGDLVLRLEEIL